MDRLSHLLTQHNLRNKKHNRKSTAAYYVLALVLLKLLDKQKQRNQWLNLPNLLNLRTYHLLTFQPLLGIKLEGLRSGIAMALE